MTFDRWFMEQFGPPPEVGVVEAMKKVDTIGMELYRARIDLSKAQKYLDKRNAALYAWNIKDKDKESKK